MSRQPLPIERAYALFEIKGMDEAKRTFEGIASTPSTDRMEDIVEPMGAKFKLPLVMLWEHGRGFTKDPVGWITSARPTKNGIPIEGKFALPEAGDPPSLVDDLDRAWALVRKKLVRGLSIGFRPLAWEDIKGSYGLRFTEWDWYELSPVAIPANGDCSINAIKSIDQQLRAASGAPKQRTVVRLDDITLPSVLGSTKQQILKGLRK